MKLLDVNILVEAHREDTNQHSIILDWLESQIYQAPGVAVSDLVLSGFVRVVTHPKVFKKPTPLKEALAFVVDLRSRSQISVVKPGLKHWEIFVDLCQRCDARGNYIPDAYHAALAIEFGLEWITLDRGFSRYPGLRWSAPLL